MNIYIKSLSVGLPEKLTFAQGLKPFYSFHNSFIKQEYYIYIYFAGIFNIISNDFYSSLSLIVFTYIKIYIRLTNFVVLYITLFELSF